MSKSILTALCSVVFLTCSFHLVISQEDRPLRLEIPTTGDDGTYTVIPCGSHGMLLFYKTTATDTANTIRWNFLWLDQSLQQRWMKLIPIPQNMEYKRFVLDEQKLFLLFLKPEKKKDSSDNLLILRIDGMNGTITPSHAHLAGYPSIDQLVYFNDKLWFTIQPSETVAPYMMSFDPGSQQLQKYRFLQDIPARIGTLRIDMDRQRLLTTRLVNLSKKQTGCLMQTFSTNGQPDMEWMFTPPLAGDLTFRSCDCLSHEDGSIFVGGIYDFAIKKSILTGKAPVDRATGFFAGSYGNGKQKFLVFCNYLEMDDLVKQMKTAKIQGGKELSMKEGATLSLTSLEWRTIVHPLTWHRHHLILQGDTYYPEYHTEYYTDYDFYGRPFTRTYPVFDGYRIQTAILAGFNEAGSLEWNLALPIVDVVQKDMLPFSLSFFSPDETLLMYPASGMIASKSIIEKTQVSQIDFSQIPLSNNVDKLLTENKNGLLHWYDNYFLLYGYQELKNINKEDKKRWVFQVTKIVLE